MADKRPSADGAYGSSSLVKRQRQDSPSEGPGATMDLTISSAGAGAKGKALVKSVKRTSSLSAPIIALTGAHQGEILDVHFAPDGQILAAASTDRTISIWNTYGDNENIGVLSGHSKAVTSLCWSRLAPRSSPRLFTSSADATLIVWDVLSGSKLRRLRGHRGIVNTLAVTRGGREILVSGADDGKVMLWDWNQREPLDVIDVKYPVTAVEFSEDGNQIYVGGLDNQIHVYDLTRKSIAYSLRGHADTILSLSLSPSGSHLLSSSQDSTLRVWDVRPFAPDSDSDGAAAANGVDPRQHRLLEGAPASFENLLLRASWSSDGERVACGSSDRSCTIWDVEKARIVYKLPGHRGTCTATDFHPKEPIIVSASTDTTLLMGEIDPA